MFTTTAQRPLFLRFWQFLHERFPPLQYTVTIALFSFSAIAYSRLSSGKSGFISLYDYAIGSFIVLTTFLLMRLYDEIKDYDDDVKYRKYLPLPRGLVRMSELRRIITAIIAVQITTLLAFQPAMVGLYAIVMSYLWLMNREFFARQWLRRHPIVYLLSHMWIIPLIDLYSSGLDWQLEGTGWHNGLLWFLAVSYLNGIVLEVGRKIRAPADEEPGVLSYTRRFGTRGGVYFWLIALATTALVAIGAAHYAGYSPFVMLLLSLLSMALSLPAWSFLRHPSAQWSKRIEYASALWTLLMYGILGAAPMIEQLLHI